MAIRPLLVLTIVAVAGVIIAAIGLPQARADGDDDYESGSGAVALGWAAIGVGALGTGSLVAYKMSRRALIATVGSGGITRSLTAAYKPALNFHMALNLIGYASGMVESDELRNLLRQYGAIAIAVREVVDAPTVLEFHQRLKAYSDSTGRSVGIAVIVAGEITTEAERQTGDILLVEKA